MQGRNSIGGGGSRATAVVEVRGCACGVIREKPRMEIEASL